MVTVLGGLAEAEGSVAKYLALWESAGELNAALHLAALVNQVADEVAATQSIRLWSHSDSVSHELVAWLTSDGPSQILEPHREKIAQVFPALFNDIEMMLAAVGRTT